ncbi:hypothetical protein CAOG_03558 [Capsaspora owczarzaki ATCC 30864]|nr:hypothetical protein CAOG_03558 [Capsaspora owczarzaki ATCC 30864]|eukprot:XP_004363286.1 hypothetical protein CAOG_03558 [Capsaspora owczarzaki ATCC 30864]
MTHASTQPETVSALVALTMTLNDCYEHLEAYTRATWARRVLSCGSDHEKFEDLNERLSQCIPALHLSLHVAQLFDREDDQRDVAADFAYIEAHQREVLDAVARLCEGVDQVGVHVDLVRHSVERIGDRNDAAVAQVLDRLRSLDNRVNKRLDHALLPPQPSGGSPGPMRQASPDLPGSLVIPASELVDIRLLGAGGFGQVWLAKYHQDTVAVKRLLVKTLDSAAMDDFRKEMAVHAGLRHQNIAMVMGACVEPGHLAIVLEYATNGTLFHVLQDVAAFPQLPQHLRDRILLEIARGMAFLTHKSILHRDLKSPNVLIDGDMHAKVTDFGLARVRSDVSTKTASQQKNTGTLQWAAPELLVLEPATPTEKADVYSFGVIAWEVLTRKLPYEGVPDCVIRDAVSRGDRLVVPDQANPILRAIITQCWTHDPVGRPTFEQLVAILAPVARSEASLVAESSKSVTHTKPPTNHEEATPPATTLVRRRAAPRPPPPIPPRPAILTPPQTPTRVDSSNTAKPINKPSLPPKVPPRPSQLGHSIDATSKSMPSQPQITAPGQASCDIAQGPRSAPLLATSTTAFFARNSVEASRRPSAPASLLLPATSSTSFGAPKLEVVSDVPALDGAPVVRQIDALRERALQMQRQGELVPAKQLFEHCMGLQERNFGKSHLQVACAATDLGRVCFALSEYAMARAMFERALAISERDLGQNHVRVGIIAHELGRTYFELGQYLAAKKLLSRARAIAIHKNGETSIQVAIVQVDIARAYMGLQEVEKAKTLLKQVLPVYEGHFGEHHLCVANVLRELDRAYTTLGNTKKAEQTRSRLSLLLAQRVSTTDRNVQLLCSSAPSTAPLCTKYQTPTVHTETSNPIDTNFVYALWDYAGRVPQELSFKSGETFTLLDSPRPGGSWWRAQSNVSHQIGYIPSNFVARMS